MNTDEFSQTLTSLSGYWPVPAMSSAESQVLATLLCGYAVEDVGAAVERLATDPDRAMRPSPAKILAAVKTEVRRREEAEAPRVYEELSGFRATGLAGVAASRAALASAPWHTWRASAKVT